ncbi:carboxylesterase [Thozetella sp. PMI_491]|nr:carboxylesterase [Thozetella sp. PMI_491]
MAAASEPSTGENVSVNINQLEVAGVLSPEGVANFLNIPFATVPARFREAKLLNPRKLSGVLKADQYGSKCHQEYDFGRDERDYLYKDARYTESPLEEFTCLNLNVYSPPEALNLGSESKKLPVFVFIHGGAWRGGNGNSEFNGNFLVQHSMSQSKPFVLVAINYRLGYFGFLTSQELREEALAAGETGWYNQGLYDQRVALKWVQKYIGHFGGDGFNVTIAGESAGAWSVLAHLKSDEPVCQYGLIQSTPSLAPVGVDVRQAAFDRLVAKTGVSASAPAAQKIAALRSLPAAELNKLLEGESIGPVWDDKWFPDQDFSRKYEDFDHFPSWVKRVVVGYTRDEMALFRALADCNTIATVNSALQQTVPEAEFLKELLDHYKISSASTDEEARKGFVALTTEAFFSRVPYVIGRIKSIPVHIFRFDEIDRNPAGGRYHGWAYHALDNLFLFRFPAVAGPDAHPSSRATSDAFSQLVLATVYGEEPCEPFARSGKIKLLDGEGSPLQDGTEDLERWKALLNTPEREDIFGKISPKLLGGVDLKKPATA